MPYIMSKIQKNQLLELPSVTENIIDLLIDNIEYQMEESFLADDGKKTVIALNYSDLFKEIAKKSKELTQLIKRLPTTLKEDLDTHLGSILTEPKEHKTIKAGNVPVMYHEDVDTLLAINSIRLESERYSLDLKKLYGSGYLEKLLDGMYNAWGFMCGLPITKITINSEYVQFIGIVLPDLTLEAIHRQIKRSKWYENNNLVKENGI